MKLINFIILLNILAFPFHISSQEISDAILIDSILNSYKKLSSYQDTCSIFNVRVDEKGEERYTIKMSLSSFFIRPYYYETDASRE